MRNTTNEETANNRSSFSERRRPDSAYSSYQPIREEEVSGECAVFSGGICVIPDWNDTTFGLPGPTSCETVDGVLGWEWRGDGALLFEGQSTLDCAAISAPHQAAG